MIMNDSLGEKRSKRGEKKQALIPSARYTANDRRGVNVSRSKDLLRGIQINCFTEPILIGNSIKARHGCPSTHVTHRADSPRRDAQQPNTV